MRPPKRITSPQQISIVLPNGAGGIDVRKTLNEAITKSHLLTAPSIQTCPPATVITNTGLGAGTLILANDQINLEYDTDNIQWPSNSTNMSRKQTITGAQSFKTPASSYSAEALIGLNSHQNRKQRNKRRGAEPIVSSTSGFNNLVDLGYLTMPPGVGSPMLTDDGMYLNHTTNFLPVSQSGTSSMYPSASSNTHGTFYSPPRPPSCATTHLSVSRTLQQSTASPNAANSSGTTLANFNLSTIFPEIIDKQSSSVPSSVYSSNSKNPLPSTHSNSPHSSALEMPRENEFLHHSRVQPVTLSNSLGQATAKDGVTSRFTSVEKGMVIELLAMVPYIQGRPRRVLIVGHHLVGDSEPKH
uniref:Uncharacterized protein n=1 Tax=Timema monikensis TaxID=170555 RepID=A0A7R9EEG6_9NEOP|nr:unnamed protein product [Timema monikensis]